MTATYDDHEERIRNLEIGFGQVVVRMDSLATKEDVQAVRTDLYRLETRLIKWMVGSVIAATIAAGSIAGVVTAVIIRFAA